MGMTKKEKELAAIARLSRWSRPHGERMVEAYRESGDSVSGFAREHGIHRERIAAWIKKLDDEAWARTAERARAARAEPRPPAPIRFAAVELAAPAPSARQDESQCSYLAPASTPQSARDRMPLSMRLPGGIALKVGLTPGSGGLGDLLSALREVYAC